jgi:hypothetical protein
MMIVEWDAVDFAIDQNVGSFALQTRVNRSVGYEFFQARS